MNVTSHDVLNQLAAAAAEGDDIAIRRLVQLTQPAVWRLCAALGDAGDEEDLVQDTYLRAIPALASYRGDADVQIWLLSIARRVCADHVRRRQRQRRLITRLTVTAMHRPQPTDDATSPLLDALAVERREAFTLTQVLGLSYDEAAVVLGCPVGTIRSRVARARADLLDAVRRADAL